MLEPHVRLRDRYRVVEMLGRGGMGAVYRAIDETFGSTVAIKQTLCEGADLEKAFQREARLLNGLRHAALPVVIDYFCEERGQFLVMQYIPGDDFGTLLDRHAEPYAPALVVQWADQLLAALQYLHEHDPQIIHRDIKPRNLKLTPTGEVVLLDFGLSKSTPRESRVDGTSLSVLGYTPHYAPFEQIQGQGTDPRSDLFALGATLYHLVTATLPPDAMVRALATMDGQPDPLRPAHVVDPTVPEALGAVIHQAMAMARDQRPATAAAMRAALRGIRVAPVASGPGLPVGADAVTVAAAPPSAPVSLTPAAATRWATGWLAASGVAAIVTAIAIVLALPGDRAAMPGTRAGSAPPPDVVGRDVEPVLPEATSRIRPAERTFAFATATLADDGAVVRAERQARAYQEDLGSGVAIEMVAIPAGEYLMGNGTAEYPDEIPQHRARIAPFYLSRYEVTQAQWRAVAMLPRVARTLDPDPSAFKGDDLPVEQVSWEDAMEFCARLSRRTHYRYRLPSETEWEYAARAGTATDFAFGDTLMPTLARYDATVAFKDGPRGPAPAGTSPVGSFGVANAFGLSDVHGNVAEWCLGEYHPSYEGAPADGRPWMTGADVDRRVLRGGSWGDLAVDCRSANRYSYQRHGRRPTIGFRLAMSLGVPPGGSAVAAVDPHAAGDPRIGRPVPPRLARPAAARVLRRRASRP